MKLSYNVGHVGQAWDIGESRNPHKHWGVGHVGHVGHKTYNIYI